MFSHEPLTDETRELLDKVKRKVSTSVFKGGCLVLVDCCPHKMLAPMKGVCNTKERGSVRGCVLGQGSLWATS